MPAAITALYTAALGALFIALSLRVVRLRIRLKAPFGTADDRRLERAIRAHGHFSEYVPFLLVQMLLLEIQGAPAALLHAYGAVLLLSRALHALSVGAVRENLRWRLASMVCSVTLLASGALGLAALWAINR